jgi:glycosyltransferase involved in cell wall biosynthesis
VRVVRFKRNFGQHPAMQAGLARARGEILVTMDGDLQNEPEDIPKLVRAVEAGSDVASGRRQTRHDSWGRTLPSRMIVAPSSTATGKSPDIPMDSSSYEPATSSLLCSRRCRSRMRSKHARISR